MALRPSGVGAEGLHAAGMRTTRPTAALADRWNHVDHLAGAGAPPGRCPLHGHIPHL